MCGRGMCVFPSQEPAPHGGQRIQTALMREIIGEQMTDEFAQRSNSAPFRGQQEKKKAQQTVSFSCDDVFSVRLFDPDEFPVSLRAALAEPALDHDHYASYCATLHPTIATLTRSTTRPGKLRFRRTPTQSKTCPPRPQLGASIRKRASESAHKTRQRPIRVSDKRSIPTHVPLRRRQEKHGIPPMIGSLGSIASLRWQTRARKSVKAKRIRSAAVRSSLTVTAAG